MGWDAAGKIRKGGCGPFLGGGGGAVWAFPQEILENEVL